MPRIVTSCATRWQRPGLRKCGSDSTSKGRRLSCPDSFPVAILAGGLATRLRPVTDKIPKSLIEVAGKPFIARQLDYLRGQGISRVVVCIGHLGKQIQVVIGDGRAFGLTIHYSADGAIPLGTGGALKRALPLLGERFFVLYGDSYLPC